MAVLGTMKEMSWDKEEQRMLVQCSGIFKNKKVRVPQRRVPAYFFCWWVLCLSLYIVTIGKLILKAAQINQEVAKSVLLFQV